MANRQVRIVLVLVILTFVIVGTKVESSTVSNSFIYSVRAQTEGEFGSGNDFYSDASKIPLSAPNVRFTGAEMYVKNSESALFIALRVTDRNNEAGVALVFDVNHDLEWAEDVKIVTRSGFTREDAYFQGGSSLSYQSSTQFTAEVNTFTYIDGSAQVLYEFRIPFTSYDPTKDLYVIDPDNFMLGLDVVMIFDSDVISLTQGTLDSLDDVNSNVDGFVTLVLAGPGRFLIPDFEPSAVQHDNATSTQTSTQYTQGGDGYDYAETAATNLDTFSIIASVTLIFLSTTLIRRRNRH